jgi:hypothetical protein
MRGEETEIRGDGNSGTAEMHGEEAEIRGDSNGNDNRWGNCTDSALSW